MCVRACLARDTRLAQELLRSEPLALASAALAPAAAGRKERDLGGGALSSFADFGVQLGE